jgi:hypothetical protein
MEYSVKGMSWFLLDKSDIQYADAAPLSRILVVQ